MSKWNQPSLPPIDFTARKIFSGGTVPKLSRRTSRNMEPDIPSSASEAAIGSMLSVHRLTTSSCSIASTARETASSKVAGTIPGKWRRAFSCGMFPWVFPAATTIRMNIEESGTEKGVSSMRMAGDSRFALNGTGRNTRESPMTRAVAASMSRRLRGGRPISTSTLPERGIRDRLDEVLLQIPRADHGDPRLHPPGGGKDGKLLDQVAQHIEEEAARPEDEAGPQPHRGDPLRPGAQDLPGVDHRLDGLVPRFLPRERPEEDDPPDTLGGARVAELRGEDFHLPVELRVGAQEPHGEVRRVDRLRPRAAGPRRRRCPPRRSPGRPRGIRRGSCGRPRGPGGEPPASPSA